MKRHLQLLMLLAAFLVPWATNAQTTVTIGTGDATSRQVPINNYYNYSITEMLYTAEEIGTAGTISSISFYYNGAAKDFPITVYMQNVDASDLSTGISLATADQVFAGTYSVTATEGWHTITLDSPFAYDGTSNLLIGINKGYLYYYSTYPWHCTSTSSTMARYSADDNNGYNTSTVPGSTSSVRPNIQIAITPGAGPSCQRPESLTVTSITTNTAYLNWTGGSGTFNVEYKLSSETNWTRAVSNVGWNYMLVNLTPATAYDVRVQSVCSDTVSAWRTATFTTACGAITSFPWSENFESYSAGDFSAPCWVNQHITGSGTNVFKISTSSLGVNSTHQLQLPDMNIGTQTMLRLPGMTLNGNYQFVLDIYRSSSTYSTSYAEEGIRVFASADGTLENATEITFIPRQYTVSSSLIPAEDETGWYTYTLPIPITTGTCYIILRGESQYCTPTYMDNFVVELAPACPTPTQLAVNYTGGNSAQVSWTSDATSWNINVNGVVTNNVTANPYTLTGLNFGTTYTIQVQANCGGDISEWTTPVSFTTDLCDTINQCAITITLTDAYGDGGGQIQVVDSVTNTVLGTYTNSGPSTTYTLNVCNGRTLNFVFASTDGWPYENGWVITDINEEVIAEHQGCTEGCDAPTNGVVATYTVDCAVTTCRRPTALAASEVGPRSVQLGWTENGEATSWVVAYAPAGDIIFTEVAAATNPYTLTGLNPATAYTVKVRPVCSDQFIRWSDPISFTTDVACPAPTSLAVTPGTTVADVNWNGNANNYTLQYTQVPTGTISTGDSIVLSYDDGSYVSGIGNSTAANWTWGVMYPASMYMGGNLTKVSVFETSEFYDTTYTVKIYSGGTTAPDSLLASQVVTPMGSDGFHEITLTTPVTIDFGQNLWIVVEAYGTFVMSSCNSTIPNNTWVYDNGSWGLLADLASSLAGHGWMIRGQINPFDLDALTWTTVNNATAPASLTGLTAETDYITRVKALCGGQDGESAWEASLFTTLDVNPIPMDVVVTPAATRAAISWRGYSDSYKVYYRTAEAENVVFSEGFESDIDTTLWKIYTVGEAPQTNGWYTYNPESGLSYSAHGGSMVASAWSWNGSAYNADNWLVTPQVTLGGTLKYWERTAASWPDHYEVIVSTTGNTVADFANGTVIRARAIAATTGEWNEVTLDLSAFSGQAGYIAFHHADTDANYLLIDDIRVIGSITPAGAWVEVPTTATNVTLTGLTPETTYDYKVTGIVNNVENAGTDIAQFTTDTQAFCPAPVITVGEFQNRTASFSWTCPGDSVFVTLLNHNGQQVWGQFFGPNDTAVNNMYFPENIYPFGYVYIYALTVCGDIADSNLSDWAYDGFAVTCDTTDQCTVSYVLHGQNGWQGGVLDVFDTVSGAIVSSLTLPAGLDTHTTTYQLCTDRTYRVAFRDGTGAGQSSFSNVAFEIVGPFGNTYFSASNPDTGTLGYFTHSCTASPDPYALPLVCDFEQEGDNGWTLENGTQVNWWMVGNATNNGGSRSLYITNDSSSNAYSVGTAAYVFATRPVRITEPGVYAYSYDWKANGESTYDFIRAALVPASTTITAGEYNGFNNTSGVPTGGIAIDGAYRLNLVTSWQTKVGEINVTDTGLYNIVFMWRNDPSGGTQPPAAIDNVILRQATCPMPQNVVATPTHNSITLTWTPAGNETSWEVSCGTTVQTVTTATYTFTGLTANTDYTVGVRALCSATESSTTVSQTVRTACDPMTTLPYTYGFEGAATGTSTNAAFDAECWRRLNNATQYFGYPYISSSSTYCHTGSRGTYWYVTTTTGTYGDYQCLVLPGVNTTTYPINTLRLKFWAKGSAATARNFLVGVMTDPTDINTFTTVETVTVNSNSWVEYTANLAGYTGNGIYVAIRQNRATSSYTTYIDDITLEVAPTCVEVSNVAAAVTSTTATVTWTDASNPSATYTVYNGTTAVATGITGNSYTVTGLTSDADYTFGVVANCSATDASQMVTVAAHTLCAVQLPYTENFDNLTTSTTATTGVHVPCWTYTMTSTSNSASYQPQVYYSSSYAHSGSYSLRLYGVAYTCLPEMNAPLSGLQLKFWDYTTSANYGLEVGVMEGSTFVPVQTITTPTSTHLEHTVFFDSYTGNSRVIAFRNYYTTSATTTTSYHYIDNVEVDYLPSCLPVTGLAATKTDNSITLTWADNLNTGATYTVSDTSGVIASGLTATTYTVTGLTANTTYTYTVTVNCSATDMSEPASITVTTNCAAEAFPFYEDFSANLSSNVCWRGATGTSAAQAFAGTQLNLTTPQWSYASSVRDGLPAGHYYKNIYGTSTSQLCWMITPTIDLSNATSAQLEFDVALTDYSNAALPDANGDTNTSQAFMVIVSTDGGNTWSANNATVWQNGTGDFTYASLADTVYQHKTISLNQYVGGTVKIAFYTQSIWSGGDNDLHLDNIAVTGDTLTSNDPYALPLVCDFEQEGDNGWTLENGTQVNWWMVGNATNNGGSRSLYITNDSSSNAYSVGTAVYVFAIRPVRITEPGVYAYSYDWKANGESTYDFIRAALVPASTTITAGGYCGFNNTSGVPTGGIAIDGAYRLNLVTSWQTKVGEINVTDTGLYNIVFMWRNDNSGGTQPPAAIDNVTFARATCPMPQNVVASPTHNSITLTWTPAGNETSWEVTCGTVAQTVNTTTYTFTGLTANTDYTVGVRALCSATETSLTVSQTVRTACDPMTTLPYTYGFEGAATGTSTNAAFAAECWRRLNNATQYFGYPYISSSSTYCHTGSRGTYWYVTTTTGTYGDYQCLVLPGVNTTTYPVNTLRLKFWTKGSAATARNFLVGVMTNPTDINTFTTVETVTVNSTDWVEHTVVLDSYTGTGAYVAIRQNRATSSYTTYIDDITLEVAPTCVEPAGVTVDNITTNGATVSWTGTANGYTVAYGTGTNPDAMTTVSATGTSTTLTGLTPNTAYNVYVKAVCSATDQSPWTNATTFRTNCATFTTPYTWTFEDMPVSTAPLCWTKVGNGTTNVLSSTTNAHNSNQYLRFSGSTSNLILLPEMASAVNTLRMRLWTRPESTTNSSCGTFSVGYVTDASDASTFVALETYTYNSFSDYEEKTVVFASAPAGARMALRHNPTSTSWYWYVDDVTVEEIPSCEAPSITDVTYAPYNNGEGDYLATVTWNSTGAQSYEFQWIEPSLTRIISNGNDTVHAFVIHPDEASYVKVRAICGAGDTSAWSDSVRLYYGYCEPTPTSVDNNGVTSVAFGGMANTTSHAGNTAAYVNNRAMVGTVPAGTTATVDITYATGYDYGTIIWVDWNKNYVFDTNEVVAVGTSASTNPTTLTLSFMIPATQDTGDYCMRIVGADSYFESYVGSIAAAANANPCASYSWGIAEDYTLHVSPAPSCLPVSNVTIGTVTNTTIDVSFTTSGAPSYDVYALTSTSATAALVNTTTGNATLTGLTSGTTYYVRVQASCGDGVYSILSEPIAVTTAFCDTTSQCPVTVILTDGYGDGWNGGLLTIFDSIANVAVATLAANNHGGDGDESNDTVLVNLCVGRVYGVSYASGQYDSEVSFRIIASDGTTQSNITYPVAGTLGYFTHSCTATPQEECWPMGIVIGNEASTTSANGYPVNNYYNYTLTETIIDEAEIGGAMPINGIRYYYNYATAMTGKTNCTIYLQPTTKTTFSSSNDIELLDPVNAVMVYTGSLNCSQGWNEFTFTTPYNYSGTGNLMVIVDDNSGSYNTSSHVFRTSACTGYKSLQWYSDSYNPDPATSTGDTYSGTKTYVQNRVVMALVTCDTATCHAPLAAVASGVGVNNATVTWTSSNATSYSVTLMSGTSVLSYSTTTDTTMAFTGLTANTDYSVVIRGLCSANDSSSAVTADFHTECDLMTTLPYTYGFEGAATGSSTNVVFDAECWKRLNNGTTYFGYPYISSSTTYCHSGSRGLYWYNYSTVSTYGNYRVIVLPGLGGNYTMSDLRLKFWAKASSATAQPVFHVGVMTDPTDISTLDTVYTVTTNTAGNTDWAEYSAYLAGYTGTGRYVAIATYPEGATWTAYVDDVTLEEAPSCTEVTNLAVAGVTSSSVTLTWTDALNTTGTTYTVSDAQGTTIASGITGTTYTVTGLTANTSYTFSVVANCSATEASGTMSVTAHTECELMTTLPYSYGFEDAATGTSTNAAFDAECWKRLNNGTTYFGYPYISSTSSYCHTGSRALYWYCGTSASYGDYQVAVLPGVGGTYEMNHLKLKFWAKASSTSYHPVFVIGVMTDPTDISTFTQVATVNVEGTTYTEYEALLASYTGTGRYVAIRSNRPTSAWTAYFDDVTLEEVSGCQPVANLAATVADNSVTLTWSDPLNTGATYTVIGANGTIATGITTTSYTVTGLTPNTAYNFSVVANCSADVASDSASIAVQTECTFVATLPYTMGFEADEGVSTGSSTSTTFIDCWHRLNNGTQYFGYPYVSTTSSYIHTGARGLYWANSTTTGTYGDYQCIVLPGLGGNYAMDGLQLKFWARATGTSYHPVLYVGVMTDPTDINSFVYVDTINVEGTTYTEYTSYLNNYTGTGRYVAIRANRPASAWYLTMDDITLDVMPSCFPVTNLTIASTTTSSMTLAWNDNFNDGATYTVSNAQGVIASNVTGTSYTVTGLNAGTEYTFMVTSNCSATDSGETVSVTGYTACATLTAADLPYTEDFEAYGSGSAYSISPCWTKGTNGSTAYPYPTSTAASGTRSLYFYGYKPSSTTGTHVYSYAALPQLDATLDASDLTLSFKARRYSTVSVSYRSIIYVGVMTNPTDASTFVAVDTINMTPLPASTIETYNVILANYTGTGKYVAFYCPWIDTNTSYSYNYIYIDDVMLDITPTCLPVADITASNATTNSVTLSWTDAYNTGATYTVYDMSDSTVMGTGITGTTYTVTGLAASSSYTFGIQANCSATDASPIMTVATRTACGVATMPWVENFDGWTAKSDCWAFLSGAFDNGAGTPTANTSAWTLSNSYGDYITISGKALAMNIYSSNRYWAVTPAISISSNTAQLTFDVAVAAWSASTPNYDANDTLAIAITTDSGLTYTPLLVYDYTQLNALGNTFTTITVPVTGYNGQNVRFAIFGGSSASGGDNRIVVDNVSVTEASGPASTIFMLSANDTTMGTVLPHLGTNTYNAGDSVIIAAVPNAGYLFDYWVVSMDNNDTMHLATNPLRNVVTTGDAGHTYHVTAMFKCDAVAFPFSENFESGVLSNCWTVDGPGTWQVGTGDYTLSTGAHTGTYNAKTVHGTTGNVTKLITPTIDFTGVTAAELRFWHLQRSWSGDQDELRVYYRTSATAAWQQLAAYTTEITAYTEEVIQLPNLSSTYQVAFEFTDGYGYGLALDDITINLPPTCTAVTALTATPTDSSVVLTWTDANTSATYTVYDMSDSTVIATGITATTYTVTGLTANTLYTFGVVANCSATDASQFTTVTVRTNCSVFTAPYTWTFEEMAASAAPECWTKVGSGTANVVSSTTASHNSTKYLRFSGSTSNLILLPEIDGTLSDLQMRLWTRPESTSNSSCGTFSVGYVTDVNDATTFVALETYSYNDFTDYDEKTVRYTGVPAGARMALRHTPTSTSWYWYVDDVTVEEIPSCLPVTGVAVTDVTLNSIGLVWNSVAGAASYIVYNMADTSVIAATVTDTFYTVTGLTAETNYTFGVKSRCSATDVTPMFATVDAFTGYCQPTPTSVDGQGITSVAFGSLTNDAARPSGAGYRNYSNLSGMVATGSPVTVDITYATGYTYGTIIWVDWNNSMTFDGNEVVYVGTSTNTNPTTLTCTFNIPADQALGSYRMRILGADSYFDSYTGSIAAAAGANPCASYSWGVAEDYTLTLVTPSVCPNVAGFTVTGVTNNSVSLSWNTVTGATYTLYNGTNVVATGITDTVYTVTGLTANTDYTFGVVANCSATETSAYPATVSAHTLCDNVNLPFVETFEATSATRNCWTLDAPSTANAITYVTFDGHTAMRFSSYATATDYNQYAYSPVFNTPSTGDSLHVRVRYATYGSSDSLWFGFRMANSNDYLWTPTAFSTTGENDIAYLEANLPINTVQLAVHYYGNYSYYAWIDSVELTTYTPGCQTTYGFDTVVACDSTVWNGNTYTLSGIYSATLTNAAGCDSVVTLNLTINNSTTGAESISACDSYTLNGITYTATTTVVDTLTTVAGCDSVVTITLTVNHSTTHTDTVNAVDSYTWHGTTYIASTVAYDTLVNTAGCDSICTLVLTITYSGIVVTDTAEACDSYTWRGTTYTASTVATDTVHNAAGADSIYMLILTINYSQYVNDTVTACDSYTWHGNTYTANATAVDSLLTVAGCDSICTLTLTINHSATGTEVLTGCDSILWNDNWYTASAIFTDTLETVEGCDSIVAVTLLINQSVTTTETVTACDSYEWNGTAYTASTVDTLVFAAVNGCDSTVILNLTVNYSVETIDSVTATDSYTWHGTVYERTTVAHDTLTAYNGCDSIQTLVLTLNYSASTIDTLEACDSATWHGRTYYNSTVDRDTLPAVSGADSICLLLLTINHSTLDTFTVSARGQYAWHDSIYTQSGTYYYHGMTFAGCDSTEVLILTVDTTQDVYYSVAIVVANTEGQLNVGGTVTGAGSYLGGTEVTLTATPDSGYLFDGWYTRSDMGFGGELISADSVYVFTLEENVVVVAMFERIGANSALLTVSVDSTMGYVLFNGDRAPFNVYRGTLGETVTLEAIANDNCQFLGWVNTLGDTISRDAVYDYVLDQTTSTLTAAFERHEGINAVDAANVTVIARENGVIVRGAAQAEVYVFDAVGRLVGHVSAANDEEFIRLSQTGVYLVKVGDLPARRVVVRQ